MLFPKRQPEHECGAPGLSPHTDTTCAMLSGTILLADAPPGVGNTTLWPGSHHHMHPLWTTCFGNAKSAAQEAATPLAMQEIVSNITPVEICGHAGDVVFWHPRIVHSAGVNRSGLTQSPQVREAVICEWQRGGPERTFLDHANSNPGPRLQFWIDTRAWLEDKAPTYTNMWDEFELAIDE